MRLLNMNEIKYIYGASYGEYLPGPAGALIGINVAADIMRDYYIKLGDPDLFYQTNKVLTYFAAGVIGYQLGRALQEACGVLSRTNQRQIIST